MSKLLTSNIVPIVLGLLVWTSVGSMAWIFWINPEMEASKAKDIKIEKLELDAKNLEESRLADAKVSKTNEDIMFIAFQEIGRVSQEIRDMNKTKGDKNGKVKFGL